MKIFRYKSVWSHIAILFFAVLLLYLPTLHHGFILDDHIGIEQNQSIKSINTVFDAPISFFRTLLLHTSYSLGELDPAYYRVMNIAFHLGTVFGIYLLVTIIVESSAIALFSALIFAVHPLLVESVVWISSLTYPQYSFFVIFSLIFYILRQRKSNRRTYTALFFAFFLLSLLSSEKALVLPVIILLYEWLFGSLKRSWKPISGGFLLISIFGGIMYPFIQERIATFSASAVSGTTELLNPFIQIPVVLGTYLNLIFWPQRLTIYHLDELGVPAVSLVFQSAFVVAYLLGLLVSYIKNKKIFFFLSVFLVASLPALIPIHIIQIAAERYAYLGTFGLITAVVLALFNVAARYKINVIWLYVILSVCVLALAWRTNDRAKDWESEMSLRLATLSTAPYSSRAHNNVGIQLMNENRDSEAMVEFEKSISLKPDYSHPYHNIGHMLAVRGRYAEALPFYLKAISLNSYEWKTRQDIGQVYFMLKKYSEAKEQLTRAIEQGSPEVERLQTILNRISELGF